MTQQRTQNLPIGKAPAAFTLIELLVVVAIMIILFTIAVPSVRNLVNSGKVELGVKLVGSASSSARSYSGLKPPFNRGVYQGTAMLFTPSNEIRLVRHIDTAKDGTRDLIEYDPPRAGYEDIPDREYIPMPAGVGAVGITRNGSGTTGLILLTPPFAVRFDAQGQLISRGITTAVNGRVHYDIDYDANGFYESTLRTSITDYEPSPYDPESDQYDDTFFDTNFDKYELPFGSIETVIGVILYEKQAMLEAGGDLQADTTGDIADTTTKDWLLENGEVVFFSRYTGARIQP